MDTVRIQTTQNVRIEYQMAGIGERLIATIVDIAISFGYIFVVAMIVRALPYNTNFPIYLFIILSLPYFFYSLIMETIFNGQTPGKRVMGTKVIHADGSQPTFTSYFLRWLLYYVDLYFSCVGLLFILFSNKSQRLGDIAAGTVVIKLHRNTYIGNTVFVKIEDGYEPKYPQAVMLSDVDVRTIRHVYNQGMADYNRDAIIALSDKIKQVLGILNVEQKPSAFILTILKDYNYYLTDRLAKKEGKQQVAA